MVIAVTVLACCSGVPANAMSMVTIDIVFSVAGCAVGLAEGACLCERGCTCMCEFVHVRLCGMRTRISRRARVCVLSLCLIARALAYTKARVLCENNRAT